MATGATGQLGLALPVQGELSGTWGDTVNNGITQYTNIAIAGTLTLTNDGAVTLANTTGDASASNIVSTLTGAGTVTAQFAIVRVTGTLTVAKVVTAPSYSKTFTVVNAATGGIVTFKAAGQTGVSVAVGESAFVYFNGTDYVKIVGTATSGAAAGSNTQVQYNNSGLLAGSSAFTFDGAQIEVDGVTIGRGKSAVSTNTSVGLGSLGFANAGVTGVNNTAMGYSALASITSGAYNTASGWAALSGSTTGSFNTAVGNEALGLNISQASNNTAVGYQAGYSATTGGFNTAIGGKSSSGRAALYSNTTGVTNTAVGAGALNFSVTASGNTAVGYEAAGSNVSGTAVNAFGDGALSGNISGSDIVAVGTSALLANLSGSNNVAVGSAALRTTSTTSNSTAVGYQAGYLSTGSTNTYFGYSSGSAVTTGAKNVIIGSYTGSAAPISATGNNHIVFSDGDGNVRGYFDSSGGLNLPGGTANGVTYLNGSKVLTSGSALTFDGTTLANSIGGGTGFRLTASSGTSSIRQQFVSTGGTFSVGLDSSTGSVFTAAYAGIIWHDGNYPLVFGVNNAEAMRLTSSSLYTASGINVGIGTSSPAALLHLKGSSNPAIYWENSTFGSAKNAAFMGSAGQLVFGRAGVADWLTIDNSGNAGLGVTPSAWGATFKAMQVGARASLSYFSGNDGLYLANNSYYNGTNQIYIATGTAAEYQQTAGQHIWKTAASGTAGDPISFTQAMTLDASGGFLVGLTSNPNSYRAIIQGKNTTTALGGEAVLNLFDGNANGEYSNLRFATSSDGPLAVIGAKAVTGGAYPSSVGQLEFGVQNGASTTTAMVIDSSGNLLVGTTSGSTHSIDKSIENDYSLNIRNTATANTYGITSRFPNASPNGAGNQFLICTDSSATRMLVYSNGGIGNYSANNVNLSDRREKTNFAPAKSYLDVICAIPVQTFNYVDQNRETDDGLTLGVVAQDVQAVAPELVTESNWGTEEEPKMRLSIYQTDLQYALMKCIQEQQAIIESLKARLDAANL